MSINERVKRIIDVLEDGSRKQFADKLGVSPAQVYNFIGPSGSIGPRQIERIENAYPTVATAWLRTEEGAMLTDGTTPEPKPAEERVKARPGRKAKAPKEKKEAKVKTPRASIAEAAAALVADVTGDSTEVEAEAEAPKKTRKRRAKNAAPAASAELKKTETASTAEPAVATTPRSGRASAPQSESLEPVTAVAALKELILSNTKLVESNQQLVDVVLRLSHNK